MNDVKSDLPVVTTSARERLASSREQMRLTMWARAHPQRRRAGGSGTGGETSSGWIDKLKSIPGVGVVVETLSEWWKKHPLEPVAGVAVEAARSVVAPLAQRHPVRLVLLAALAGAVLVKSRPRRWLLTRASFAGLVPLLAVKLLDRMPIESWIGVLARTPGASPPASNP